MVTRIFLSFSINYSCHLHFPNTVRVNESTLSDFASLTNCTVRCIPRKLRKIIKVSVNVIELGNDGILNLFSSDSLTFRCQGMRDSFYLKKISGKPN